MSSDPDLQDIEDVQEVGRVSATPTAMVNFFCKNCNIFHKIKIDQALFESREFPVSYTYLHGDPPFAAVLYIDANYKVRGVEYSKGFAVGKTELDEILLSSKARCLSNIPNVDILAFRLLQDKSLLKFFTQQGFEATINFTSILDMMRHSSSITTKGESCMKLYLKFSDIWVTVLEMMEYKFILVVRDSIDIEHLETQSMAMFEALMS
jgi:hypothetical protein